MTMANLDETTEGPRSFARFAEQACSGALHADMSQEMHELLGIMRRVALTSNGSKGSLTLTLNFSLDGADQVETTYSIKNKVPQPTRRKGLMFLTPGGNLQPDNPRQRSLPLSEVTRAPRENHRRCRYYE